MFQVFLAEKRHFSPRGHGVDTVFAQHKTQGKHHRQNQVLKAETHQQIQVPQPLCKKRCERANHYQQASNLHQTSQ